MHDSQLMEVLYTRKQLLEHPARLALIDTLLLDDVLKELAILAKFHHQK